MDDSGLLATTTVTPTATRPLLGQTILVVEDSRYACDAIRLMCLHSGARIRRADCLKSARRHLQIYRPSVILIDMGLPDGSGADLIAKLSEATPRISVIMGLSGDDTNESQALAAGADGFLAKPLKSMSYFQKSILERLPEDRRPSGLHAIRDEVIQPDPLAYQDDMAHIADFLTGPNDQHTLDYAAQFLQGVAREAGDKPLTEAARKLALSRASGAPLTAQAAQVAGMVQNRLERREAI
ncbi:MULTISPECIES: response regulator [unclassified Ruegeria]|uniref:response regulator n=1 Tax=unclassified Ruegeria TaxID=2625375 RepID=UPI001488021E|nr:MULTISPECIES: response regulator [unclassified Ruegeria]NOD75753.1 response regulator [Ruegeria sp. HKCCD4332]NOD88936.1 response regulator [Ruegeria sp. HKCCD4318]NOE14478.1 response regulator [Ruegeria sp. HKCCD4318-2]NOG10001.1 response regulator [Ruegeria sp. HKCCD4315]